MHGWQHWPLTMNKLTHPCLVLVTLILTSSPAAQPADWGDDVIVASVPPGFAPRKLTSDCDADGDIYLALLCQNLAAGDSVFVWRSTTGGHDWSRAYAIGSPLGAILDYEFRTGSDSGGSWLYDFVIADDDSGLRIHRHRPILQNEAWRTICRGDSLGRVSADVSVESTQHVFAAWLTDSGNTYVACSDDSGENWNNRHLTFTHSRDPSVCAGGNGNVYVAAGRRDSLWIDLMCYRDCLTSSDSQHVKLDSGRWTRTWFPRVAADREGADLVQAAMVLFGHVDSLGARLPREGWTGNGGRTWNTAYWPVAGQTPLTLGWLMPSVRQSTGDDLFRAVVLTDTAAGRAESVAYAYARPSSPMLWEERRCANDVRASASINPTTGYSWRTAGGYFAYCNDSGSAVYFDAFDFPGQNEMTVVPPLVTTRSAVVAGDEARITLWLAADTRVGLAIMDAAGSLLSTSRRVNVAGGRRVLTIPLVGLASGAYFVRIATDDRTETVRLLKVR
jgi:hypothetical protein